jgi:hypothetical protein
MKPTPPVTVDVSILRDPELIVRVKRRVGPTIWHIVAVVLASTKSVLEEGLDKPDRFAPGGAHSFHLRERTKKVNITSSGVPKRRGKKSV